MKRKVLLLVLATDDPIYAQPTTMVRITVGDQVMMECTAMRWHDIVEETAASIRRREFANGAETARPPQLAHVLYWDAPDGDET